MVDHSHSNSCSQHISSKTPRLDSILDQEQSRKAIDAIISALSDIRDNERCTTCAIKDAAHSMTIYARELQAAKKQEKWTKEDKKAMKAEAKSLIKEIKRDVKKTWKAKP